MSYATVQDLAERLGTTFDPADIRAVRALEDASALVDGYTKRTFGLLEDEEATVNGSGTRALVLPQFPVAEVSDVLILDDNGTLTAVETTDYRLLGPEGILVRLLSGDLPVTWPRGYRNIVLTYTHGYDTIPDGIKAATCEIAGRLQASVASVGSSGVVTSETIGNFSQTFADTGGGAVDATGLTSDERAMLDPFRQLLMA